MKKVNHFIYKIPFPFHRMKSFRKYSIARNDYDWNSSAFINKKAKNENNVIVDMQGGTNHIYFINVTYTYNKPLGAVGFIPLQKVNAWNN